jgi:hypothetical protein
MDQAQSSNGEIASAWVGLHASSSMRSIALLALRAMSSGTRTRGALQGQRIGESR